MRPLSNLAAGLWLLSFALVSWTMAVLQWTVTGAPSIMLVATAGMFTAMLIAWPLALRLPIDPRKVLTIRLCRQCQSAPIPGFKFCLNCGLYPKVSA